MFPYWHKDIPIIDINALHQLSWNAIFPYKIFIPCSWALLLFFKHSALTCICLAIVVMRKYLLFATVGTGNGSYTSKWILILYFCSIGLQFAENSLHFIDRKVAQFYLSNILILLIWYGEFLIALLIIRLLQRLKYLCRIVRLKDPFSIRHLESLPIKVLSLSKGSLGWTAITSINLFQYLVLNRNRKLLLSLLNRNSNCLYHSLYLYPACKAVSNTVGSTVSWYVICHQVLTW